MSIIDTDAIIKFVEQGLLDEAKNLGEEIFKELSKDASAFMSRAAPSLARYITLAVTKQINLDELKSLILGLVDLAQMAALTEAGLAEVNVDGTRNFILKTVTGLVVGTVSKMI